MNFLWFDFDVSECNGWPHIRTILNHQLIEQRQITDTTYSLRLDLTNVHGPCHLIFERFNKTDRNTIVDSQGNIVKDQCVTLQKIRFDNVELPISYLWQGVFEFNGSAQPGALSWGPNGQWHWYFDAPVLDWAIAIKNTNRQNVKELFVPVGPQFDKYKNFISTIKHEFDDF
jgi:hypothetical protein